MGPRVVPELVAPPGVGARRRLGADSQTLVTADSDSRRCRRGSGGRSAHGRLILPYPFPGWDRKIRRAIVACVKIPNIRGRLTPPRGKARAFMAQSARISCISHEIASVTSLGLRNIGFPRRANIASSSRTSRARLEQSRTLRHGSRRRRRDCRRRRRDGCRRRRDGRRRRRVHAGKPSRTSRARRYGMGSGHYCRAFLTVFTRFHRF